MSIDIYLLLIGILSVVSSAVIAIAFISQQKLLKERKIWKNKQQELGGNYEAKLRETSKLHQQELNQLRELYLNSKTQPKVNLTPQTQKQNTNPQNQQIVDAERIAKGIIAEAQEKSRLLLAKQEKELQKSLVKIVIQVVKRVLNKTLTYEEHRQIIMDAFNELN